LHASEDWNGMIYPLVAKMARTSGLVEGSLAVERSEAPLNTLAWLAGEQHAQLQLVAVVVRRTIGHGRHLCEWMLRPPIPVNLPR
jgi:hypothetical protein